MISLLRENPLLLLFLVTGVGYVIGRIPIFGIQLNAAAILFVGLFVGALDPTLEIPALVPRLGLVIFVYALGLSSGNYFFRTIEEQGQGYIRFVIINITIQAAVATATFFLFGFSSAETAGLFAGASTNTAALASILDTIQGSTEFTDDALALAVIGYSLSYPIGLIGGILSIATAQKVLKIDYAAEAIALQETYPMAQDITNRAMLVTNTDALKIPFRHLQQMFDWNVVFGLYKRGNETLIVSGDTQLEMNDVLVVAGSIDEMQKVASYLGEIIDDPILTDQSVYVRRRLFVSNPDIAGQSIASLNLKDRYGAIITRVRRGDDDLLAKSNTVLELGDRVRVLAHKRDMDKVVELFGDSYTAVSRPNLLAFSIGVTLGLLLGSVTISFPGGIDFRLGFAGGPLIVALIFGAIQRTGSMVWTMPYSATQTMQQFGLMLLLSGIGISSGNTLVDLVIGKTTLLMILSAVMIVFTSTTISILLGYKLLKIPFSILSGLVASQPAVLNYLSEKTNNQLPSIGYAIAFPTGIIFKVAYAQMLLILLDRFF